MMSRPTRWSALLPLLLAVTACGDDKPKDTAPVVRPVRVMRIGQQGHTVATEFVGVTKSSKEIALSFRVAGTIDSLRIKLGDEVKKNDLVATLDTAEASLQVQAAQADLAKARAQKTRFGADYKRAKAMYESQTISTADLDASRAMIDSANADIAAVKQSLNLAQTRVSYHALKARADGVIAKVLVEENENVNAGSPVALLNAGEGTIAEVGVPSAFISRISVGTRAKVTLTALDNLVVEGTVSEVGVAATEAATTFPVKIRFDEQNERMRAGMSVSASLALSDDVSAALFIPPRAVLHDPKGHRVFVAEKKGDGAVVHERKITIGRPTTTGVEVKSGLAPGDLLIIAGMTQIREGLEVTILEESVPSGAERRLRETFPELARKAAGTSAPEAPKDAPPKPEAPTEKAPKEDAPKDAKKDN